MTDPSLSTPQHDGTEYRVFGPPGCGKTTWLGAQVKNAHEQGRRILVSSLTRTAAAEVAGRDLPIPPEHVGTLHAHCFHMLGQPQIAENRANIADWNENFPSYEMGGRDRERNIDEDNIEPPTDSPGDQLMARYQTHRARMDTALPHDVAAFAQAWTEWKNSNRLMDFTDLIETCLRDTPVAPDVPDVIFVDEAQDLDYLEMALVRKWGRQAGYLVMVGDPDQCLYRWRGSDPEAFTHPPLPADQRRVLAQSYRVPTRVHAAAVNWINKVKDREPVEYHPRDADGEVRDISADYKHPESAIDDARKYLDQGKSIMFLTSCAYMLDPLLAILRKQGIPFHNPHRRTNGAWNPLQKRRNSTNAADRLLAFLSFSEFGQWSALDIQHWTNNLTVDGVLPRKGRQAIKDLQNDEDDSVSWEAMRQVLTPEAIEAGLTGDIDWYRQHLMTSKKPGTDFPISVVKHSGADTLRNPPLTVAGTIHSVKGGEADVVYLFPDLSRAGVREWNGSPEQRASVYRLFYVGITRARESLITCSPATNMAVTLS